VPSTRALTRADQVQDPTKAAAWVGRVVRNAVVDELRKRRYLTLPLRRAGASLSWTMTKPPGPIASACWCRPSSSRRSTARSCGAWCWMGRRSGTPRKSLGLKPNNASVRLHRAKQALRERLVAHCGQNAANDCGACQCETGAAGRAEQAPRGVT
jgi:hypothetical protein